MYEQKHGLGWSDIADYPACGNIPGGGVERCFLDHVPSDLAIAQYNGCVRLGTSCRTTSGNAGYRWCCPPFTMQSVPAGGDTARTLLCQSSRQARGAMQTDRERALWDVQNRLCELGLDPGPVSGRWGSPSFTPAVRAFQVNSRITATGTPDEVTLRAMGFSSLDVARMATLVGPPASFTSGFRTGDSGALMLPLLIAGSLAAGGLLLFGVHKFTEKR